VIVAPALERREQKEGRGWKEWEGRKTDVIENKDVVEMVVVVKTTKTIIPIKIIETVETTKTIIPIKVIETVETAKTIIPIEVTVIEPVETTKSIVSIEVAIVETVKAECGVLHSSVLHRHRRHSPEHRTAAYRHPRH
jgi:hypothetical protein